MSKNKDILNDKMSTEELSTGIGILVYDYQIQIIMVQRVIFFRLADSSLSFSKLVEVSQKSS